MKKIKKNRRFFPEGNASGLIIISGALLFLFSFTNLYPKTPLWSDPDSVPTLPEEVAERESIDSRRKAGFPDYEVDALHAAIGQMLVRIDPDNIPEGPGNFTEMTDGSTTRKIIRGTDSTGKNFYRIRIRDGMGYSTEIYPEIFTYRVDCYLYPGAQGLEKTIFHFYRINHGRNNYVREMRRFIHPAPGSLAAMDGNAPQEGPSPLPVLASNAGIQIEYYEAPASVTPTWEGSDGVPLPVFDFKPELAFTLIDEKNPMPYRRQVAVVRRYKLMLRSALAALEAVYRSQELEKGLIIEKVMEF